MEDKTHHCGASESAALPLLEGTTAEKRRGKEKEATSPSIAPERPAEPERGARSGNAALPRPGSAAALAPAPGSSRSPFSDRLSASSSLPPSLPQRLLVAARSPRARRVPDAVPPSAGGSSRCHFTPTSRRRRRQLLLLNSRRSGGMKSSSPPPPRAAALRSRRGGGDGPVARRSEPRGALALHPPRRGRRSRGSTRARLPRNLRGAVPSPACGGGPGDPPQARRRHGPLRPAPAVPSRDSPPRQRAARRSCPACGAARPAPAAVLGTARRTALSGGERGGAAPAALQGRSQGERPRAELSVYLGLAVWSKIRCNPSGSWVGSLFPLSPSSLRTPKRS